MGKCVFNPRWLDRGEFPLLDWVTNSAQGKYHVHCQVCDCELNIGSGGISTLKAHMGLDKHTNNVERLAKRTNSMRNYVSMTPSGSPGNSSPTPGTSLGTASPAAAPVVRRPTTTIQAACRSVDVLKAEILWVLTTVKAHCSYNSNASLTESFKYMFTDSAIASAFTCGKDKSRYLLVHGIAPYVRNLLIKEIKISFPMFNNNTSMFPGLFITLEWYRLI